MITSQKIINSFPKDLKTEPPICDQGIFLDIKNATEEDWKQIQEQSGIKIFKDIEDRREIIFDRKVYNSAEWLVLDIVFNFMTSELPWVLVKKELSFPF